MKDCFVFLAEGFEEIEALTAVDVMRRAGMPVKTISITNDLKVVGAHGIPVLADALFSETEFEDPEWLVLPGGMPGAINLHDYEPLMELVRKQVAAPIGHIAAICAAPAVVLGVEGLLKGRKATCYPGFEDKLLGAEYNGASVLSDDKFVLANGPASAMLWAREIIKVGTDEVTAESTANGMLLYNKLPADLDYLFG
jgi:4-methyl-5(b-hydroxyethyl)-thiazole monophosphate biosynthesis